MTVSISHDGKEWSEVKTVKVEMADAVSVGIAAVNSSDLPFSVEFEEFTIEPLIGIARGDSDFRVLRGNH